MFVIFFIAYLLTIHFCVILFCYNNCYDVLVIGYYYIEGAKGVTYRGWGESFIYQKAHIPNMVYTI